MNRNADDRESYERALAERLSRLLVAAFRRRHPLSEQSEEIATMKRWIYLQAPRNCGSCNRRIGTAEPVLIISIQNAVGPVPDRMRCANCAGEPIDRAQLARSNEAA